MSILTPDLPLSLAEVMSFWANWVLVVALLVGVVATYGIVVSSNVKEAHWQQQRLAADDRIAINEAEAARAAEGAALANAEFARAKESAAEAIAKAAELQKEAAELRLALDREIAARSPREIDGEKRAIMLAILEASPKGIVQLNPKWLDTESDRFAAQLKALFVKAGFEVSEPSTKILNFGVLGIVLVIRDSGNEPPHLREVARAFEAAGFQVSLHAEEYVADPSAVFIGISSKP